jgi:hypothetical protein
MERYGNTGQAGEGECGEKLHVEAKNGKTFGIRIKTKAGQKPCFYILPFTF